MDIERIEEILRANFPASDSDGPRRRILDGAFHELRPPKPRVRMIVKWVFAVAVVAIILIGNISDQARQVRLARGSNLERGISDMARLALAQRQNPTFYLDVEQIGKEGL
ncbi:MAG: hypothetical protein Q7N50_06570 [Armatimonadota bacterium]|nr:hypothetical protein [Armatimonadota bacterium]